MHSFTVLFCNSYNPKIITEVKTTPAPIADGDMTTPIHAALQAKDLLPVDNLVDTGYLDADLLVTSQQSFGVNLVGPTRLDTAWQARQAQGGFAAENFKVDWEHKQATCPAGKTSQHWLPAPDTRGNASIHIRFNKVDCAACPFNVQCTRSQPPRWSFTVRPQPQQLALQAAREREKTAAFKKQYAHTLGVPEGVSSWD